MKEINTKYGAFYYIYNEDYDDYDLYDSDQKFITRFYSRKTIKEIENIENLEEIVNILALDNITWADSLKDLVENINDIYQLENEYKIEENYDFTNRVGNTYFIIDFE